MRDYSWTGSGVLYLHIMKDWLMARLFHYCTSASVRCNLTCSKQLQTSHIIDYQAGDLERVRIGSQRLISTVSYSNCTKRRGGQPFDNAIMTGGQLVRISQVEQREHRTPFLVWSSLSYAEGEYDAILKTPPVGPPRSP